MIGQALNSVMSQTRAPDEIIVIDQSDDERTASVVAAFGGTQRRVRLIRVTVKGLSRAYNLACASTTADVIAFTDDDCVAGSNWLEGIVQCFGDEPDVGLVYGQVLLPQSLHARENVDGVTPALPIPGRRRLSRHDGFKVFGMGANFAARRSMLLELGGFDEVLGGGGPLESAQDFDLSYRAYRRGHVILLAPEVVVYHFGFRSYVDWPRTIRSYGLGTGGFYCKYVRLGDAYATWLLGGVLIRQTLRAIRATLLRRRAARLDWSLLAHTVKGVRQSFGYPIDRRDMRYRLRLERATQ